MDTFEGLIEEAQVALRDLTAARPALAVAVETATRQAFEAAKQFENLSLRVARGTRYGADELTPAVGGLLDHARRARDRANAAQSVVQRQLKNLDFSAELRRSEIRQLGLVADPPVEGRGPHFEVAKRPKPPDVVADNIVFPAGKPPPDSAA